MPQWLTSKFDFPIVGTDSDFTITANSVALLKINLKIFSVITKIWFTVMESLIVLQNLFKFNLTLDDVS